MKYKEDNPIVLLSFEFARLIVGYTAELQKLKHFNISNQLFRSGTSIGANVREAQNAESKADFIHKMKIAAKEADESIYWLELCAEIPGMPSPGYLIEKSVVLHKILNRIIGTSKTNRK
jgi:four helix bundle protein